MNKHLSIFTVAFLIVSVGLALCASAQAQGRRARGRTYTKEEVDRIIKRVETRSDEFVKEFDKALDKSALDKTEREDELNRYAKDLEKALDELRREFHRRDLWIENKSEVRKCLDMASEIDVAMRNRQLGGEAESTWTALRFDLNTLAKVYDLPLVGSKKY